MVECYYGCGATDELRPYGPDGSDVCFDCAMASPEREAETARNFDVVVSAAEAMSPVGGIVVDADGVHPMPGGGV